MTDIEIWAAEMMFALLEARAYIEGGSLGCPDGYSEKKYMLDLINSVLKQDKKIRRAISK